MKKKIKIMIVVLFLVTLVIIFNNPSKVKTNRKNRENFKKNLLTYQTNIDLMISSSTIESNVFLNIDISEVLEGNTLYFDNETDFVEDYLKDSLYDYEEEII